MHTASKLSLAVLALVVFSASAAQAQTNNATIQATATVQSPINVAGFQPLAFGNVFPGVNKLVDPSDLTNAGRFDVTGQASTAVTLSFTLPATLTGPGAPLPIGAYQAIRADDASQLVNPVFFGPGASNAATLSGAGALHVWVGATVTPPTNQAAGVYTGTITMTVVY
jgi:spore coat protein U-like protein